VLASIGTVVPAVPLVLASVSTPGELVVWYNGTGIVQYWSTCTGNTDACHA
jgi:hypothetical protein